MLKTLWIRLTVPTDWTAVPDECQWFMRRRVGNRIQTRLPTDEEARNAE